MCYPPRETSVTLVGASHQSETQATRTPTATPNSALKPDPAPAAAGASFLSQATQGGWRNAALFLLLGARLSLYPCVLPMYPILSAIIPAAEAYYGARRQLVAGLCPGMALTYTLFGLAVAALGASLQAWMQQTCGAA